jgi:two-component system sensor histidine kinase VicK
MPALAQQRKRSGWCVLQLDYRKLRTVARRSLTRTDEAPSERLERLERANHEFLAMVAHEIRDPMTSCIGYAELLLQRHDDMTEEERDEALRTIAKTGRRLVDLLEDILEVSRLDAGSLPYVMRPIDLREVVTAVLDEQRLSLEAVPLELDMPEPTMVQGDPDRLHQVIANLVSNAVKFSDKGTPVRITVTSAGGEVELAVRDEGIGVEPGDISQLFERFVRVAQPGEQERIPGTGLGLYIARSIVEAHHGRIWAESTPGQGSVFHVVLPAATA